MCDICREALAAGYITKGEFWRCPYNSWYQRRNWEAHGAVLRKHPDDSGTAQPDEGLLHFYGLNQQDINSYLAIVRAKRRALANPERRYLYNGTTRRSSRRVGARRSLRKPSVGGERLSEGESEQLRINEFMRE